LAQDVERNNILENVKTTLEEIREGDTYNYTPAKVTREPLSFDAVEFFPTYVVLDGPEDFEYYGKRVVNSFMVLIRCIHKAERGFDYSTKINNMIKDIRHALVQDVERGGYASNTEIIHVETDEGWIPDRVTCEITVRIQYLTLEVYR